MKMCYINKSALHLPPHTGHQLCHTLLWNGIPFLNQHLLQVCQCGCVGPSGTNSNSRWSHMCSLWLRTGLEASLFLPNSGDSLINLSDKPTLWGQKLLGDGVWSQTVEFWPLVAALFFNGGRSHPTPSHCFHQILLPCWSNYILFDKA